MEKSRQHCYHECVYGGSPAYAMVGMAAVLAGSAKARTAILLLFEMTRTTAFALDGGGGA